MGNCARGTIKLMHVAEGHYELRIVQTEGTGAPTDASVCLTREEVAEVRDMFDEMFPAETRREFRDPRRGLGLSLTHTTEKESEPDSMLGDILADNVVTVTVRGCPGCQGSGTLRVSTGSGRARIDCNDGGCRTTTGPHETAESAIRAWNGDKQRELHGKGEF